GVAGDGLMVTDTETRSTHRQQKYQPPGRNDPRSCTTPPPMKAGGWRAEPGDAFLRRSQEAVHPYRNYTRKVAD
ncbi:hypothetical protein CRG98_031216, partial [Punica granatum]